MDSDDEQAQCTIYDNNCADCPSGDDEDTVSASDSEAEKVLYFKDNTNIRGDNLGSNAKEHPSTSLPPISGFCYRASLISPSNYHKYSRSPSRASS